MSSSPSSSSSSSAQMTAHPWGQYWIGAHYSMLKFSGHRRRALLQYIVYIAYTWGQRCAFPAHRCGG
eukprot:6748917-Pyramimonas_sp.AAC.1